MAKRTRIHPISRTSAAVFILLIAAATGRSQQPGPVTPPIFKDPKFDTLERQNREATLRSAELPPPVEKPDQKRIAAAIEQIKEDFRRIQIVRNQVAHSVLANEPFDFRSISEQAREISKRAERLKSYLAPTHTSDKEKSRKSEIEFSDGQMKSALARLCHVIDSFVESPSLKNPAAVDAAQSTKIGNELSGIIELSTNIKRSAERLDKAPK